MLIWQEEQMLKQSIFAKLTGHLQSYLLYMINHTEQLSNFMQLYKITEQVLAVL